MTSSFASALLVRVITLYAYRSWVCEKIQIMSFPEAGEAAVANSTLSRGIEHEKDIAVDGSTTIVPREQESYDVSGERTKSSNFKVTILMLCLVSVVVARDAVIVASTLPSITVALEGASLKAFWVGTSYLLAQTVSISYILYFSAILNVLGCRSCLWYDFRHLVSRGIPFCAH